MPYKPVRYFPSQSGNHSGNHSTPEPNTAADEAHRSELRSGILLVNLGTPDAPTTPALKRYLREFLSDPRVIELPRLQWSLILNLFVLPFRPKKSAALYKTVWSEGGSPLLVTGRAQRDALQVRLDAAFPGEFVVALGMRYGNPSVKAALDELFQQGARRIFVLPLYPQYAGATTGSTFDAVADVLKGWRWVPELRFATSYHDHPLYIQALARSVREVWERDGERPERLLMSFHGIPKRYFLGGDPYHCHCQKTGRLLAEMLGLTPAEYLVSFQSLFGKEEWIRPYTNETLEAWAKEGIKRVDVICPGFSADCLETLEEIEEQNREVFIHGGGERYRYIPALNDRADHLDLLMAICEQHAADWFALAHHSTPAGTAVERVEQARTFREVRGDGGERCPLRGGISPTERAAAPRG